MKNKYKFYAEKLMPILNKQELSEFTELLETDSRDEFWVQVAKINKKINPKEYTKGFTKNEK